MCQFQIHKLTFTWSYHVCLFAVKVCVDGTAVGSIQGSCKPGKLKRVAVGDNCWKILSKFFRGSQARYQLANGKPCKDQNLYYGYPYCIL